MAAEKSIVLTGASQAQFQREQFAIVNRLYQAKSILDVLAPKLDELCAHAEGVEHSQRACDIDNVVTVVRELIGELPEQLDNLRVAVLGGHEAEQT